MIGNILFAAIFTLCLISALGWHCERQDHAATKRCIAWRDREIAVLEAHLEKVQTKRDEATRR